MAKTITVTHEEMRATDGLLCWRSRGFPHRLRACSLPKWHFLHGQSNHRFDMRLKLEPMTWRHFLSVSGNGFLIGVAVVAAVAVLVQLVVR